MLYSTELDSEIVFIYMSVSPSVCLYPKNSNRPSFVNIKLAVVVETSIERSAWILHHGIPIIRLQIRSKFNFELYFDLIWNAEITPTRRYYLISLVHWWAYFHMKSIKIMQISTYICVNSLHIYVSTSLCLEPSFFMTTSEMHHRLFYCRHLVFSLIIVRETLLDKSAGAKENEMNVA